MCDNIQATLAELRGKGVEVARDVSDQGWGLLAAIRLPDGSEMPYLRAPARVAHLGLTGRAVARKASAGPDRHRAGHQPVTPLPDGTHRRHAWGN